MARCMGVVVHGIRVVVAFCNGQGGQTSAMPRAYASGHACKTLQGNCNKHQAQQKDFPDSGWHQTITAQIQIQTHFEASLYPWRIPGEVLVCEARGPTHAGKKVACALGQHVYTGN